MGRVLTMNVCVMLDLTDSVMGSAWAHVNKLIVWVMVPVAVTWTVYAIVITITQVGTVRFTQM